VQAMRPSSCPARFASFVLSSPAGSLDFARGDVALDDVARDFYLPLIQFVFRIQILRDLVK
jgi:hypothetical protein